MIGQDASTNVATTVGSVEPAYFESAGRALFGCYHPPARSTANYGIVICQPTGHEYVWCHRACRTLADQLARLGFPVLRFDYTGTGDSAGDMVDGRRDVWRDDVIAAVGHLEEVSRVRRVCLIGLRLGATLATLAAARRRSIERLALWQPVVDGSTFLEELTQTHRRYEESTEHRSAAPGEAPDHHEILGFLYTPELREDLSQFDLVRAMERPPSPQVLLLENGEKPGDDRLSKQLEMMQVRVERQHCPDPEIWLAEPYKMLMPRRSIDMIASWFTQLPA